MDAASLTKDSLVTLAVSMCARYSLTIIPDELSRLFHATMGDLLPWPQHNIPPRTSVPIIRPEGGQRILESKVWGWIPSWSPKLLIINARGEEIRRKPMFQEALADRRCLVPATGFFEWETVEGRKLPHHYAPASGRPFAFAGLWQGDEVLILTMPPNELVSQVHDRMPAMLGPAAQTKWLEEDQENALGAALKAIPPEALTTFLVTPKMNSVCYLGEDATTPLAAG